MPLPAEQAMISMLAGLGGSCFALIGDFARASVPTVDARFHDLRHSAQVVENTRISSSVPTEVLKFHVHFPDSSLPPATRGESWGKLFDLP